MSQSFYQVCSLFFLASSYVQWGGGLVGGTSADRTAEQELQETDFILFLVICIPFIKHLLSLKYMTMAVSVQLGLPSLCLWFTIDCSISLVPYFVYALQTSVLSPSYDSYGTRQTGLVKKALYEDKENLWHRTVDYLMEPASWISDLFETKRWRCKHLLPSSSPSSTWSFAQVRWNVPPFQKIIQS